MRQQRTVNGFSRRFTDEDTHLLAAMDERHNTPNGLAIKKPCERYLIPALEQLLEDFPFEILDTIVYEANDNEVADKRQEARRQRFKSIHERGNMRA